VKLKIILKALKLFAARQNRHSMPPFTFKANVLPQFSGQHITKFIIAPTTMKNDQKERPTEATILSNIVYN